MIDGFVEHVADLRDYKFVNFIREAVYDLKVISNTTGTYGHTEYRVLISVDKVKYELFKDDMSEYQKNC